MKIVLDASVLLAAARGETHAFALLRALRAGDFESPASLPLLLQWEAVLRNGAPGREAGQSLRALRAFARSLAALCQPVLLNPLWRPLCRDEVDDLLLATAHASGARTIVTVRDTPHMVRPAWRLGHVLLSPAQGLQALKAPPPPLMEQ